MDIEILNKELAMLQARAEEIETEYSRAETTRDAAREELISGSGTLTTLTQAQATATALHEASAEIERRIEAKQHDIAAANAAEERARKVAELEAAAAEYNEMRDKLLARGEVLAEMFSTGIPDLLRDIKKIHNLHLLVTNAAAKLQGVATPSTADYFVIRQQIEALAGNPVSRRSFAAALETFQEVASNEEQSRQRAQDAADGLFDRTHTGETGAQIVEGSPVLSNFEALVKVAEGKTAYTRF
jgi:DNA repair exonuclease SbcCD ATPase subunit